MKSRKKQPAATRQALLEAAGRCFSVHGYAGTGLGAIVADAGVTKGALFHHFADKRALALSWIEQTLAPALAEEWLGSLASVDSLDALARHCRDRCLALDGEDPVSVLVALAAETGHADTAMGESFEGVFAQWRRALAAVLERGQRDSWVHPSIVPATEAGILGSMFAGMSVVAKCGADERGGWAGAIEAYLETLRPQ